MTATTAAELRSRWAAGRPAHGLWSLLPGAVSAELLAGTGPDYVVFDLQHGALAEADLPGVTAAVVATGAVPLVRTRSAQFADVGRPLDLGAHGVLVPNVRGADHVREVVAACRYAPAGTRSAGRLSGGSDAPLVMIVLETAEALDDLDAVLAVDGLDGIYVGPMDLSLSQGHTDPTGDHMQAVISSVIARAVAAGMPVGVHAPGGGAQADRYAAQGATIVTAAVDTVALTEAVQQHLALVRGDAGPRAPEQQP
jgi:4-hydroxy-2-oxoheptanedioate aldolase